MGTLILKRGDARPDDIKIAEEASIYDGADCPIVDEKRLFHRVQL